MVHRDEISLKLIRTTRGHVPFKRIGSINPVHKDQNAVLKQSVQMLSCDYVILVWAINMTIKIFLLCN